MRAALRSAHQSGRLYLGLAAASATGAAALTLVSERETRNHQQMQQEFDAMLAKERIKAQQEEAERNARLKDAPALWKAELRNADRRLNGHVMLRNANIGAQVEVLEERQGPDERYLTVRDLKTRQIGWYPVDWVSKEQ